MQISMFFFVFFFCHQESLIWNPVWLILDHWSKNPALTVVTSFKAYVSDVIGRLFDKARNGHRFENWTPLCGLDVD